MQSQNTDLVWGIVILVMFSLWAGPTMIMGIISMTKPSQKHEDLEDKDTK